MGTTIKGEDDWAIVGGTGHFEMARGVIRRKIHEKTADEEVQVLTVDGFCRVKLPTPQRMGPCDGNRGSAREIPGNKPQRLESISIRSSGAVDSISFSYYDEAGKISNSGRWGGGGGSDNPTFTFGPSEFVKEISGSIYDQYLSTLKIVTNLGRTYGPFGDSGPKPTRFSFTVPDDKTVVGFFAKSDKYLNAIGIYTV
ncbi:protein GOS9-like [Triticum urartu]|uniref:protein GOS9-like n=1 Tax=Triticum urartu TaxID=4572 RepID=UPI0020446F15|nr:protein GOS9-like [Triticum urartu]